MQLRPSKWKEAWVTLLEAEGLRERQWPGSQPSDPKGLASLGLVGQLRVTPLPQRTGQPAGPHVLSPVHGMTFLGSLQPLWAQEAQGFSPQLPSSQEWLQTRCGWLCVFLQLSGCGI